MNILWLSHLVPYPPKGGVKQRSFNLMKEASRYHNLFIICFSQKSQQPTPEKRRDAIEGLESVGSVVAVYTFDSDLSKWSRVFLAAKSLFTKNPYTINWLQKPGVGLMIEQTIAENHIDLIHFDTISWAAYFENASGCKSVLNHHNIESHMMLRRAQKENNFIKKLYYYQEGRKLRSYENHICDHFDLNITCSPKDSERLLHDSPGLKVDIIPNGVDLNYFYPLGHEQQPNSMVFAGGMSWYPNVSAMEFFARRVWPELIREVPDARMTLIGRHPPQWIKDFAENNVGFNVTGFVEDVRPYIDKATVYVCPITDGGGTKLKILDALAMGKAIIAHPIACEGIDVVAGKSIIFSETPEDYVKNIKMLFNDSELRKNLGIEGRKLIEEKYDYLSIGRKLNRLYSAL